MKRQTSPKFGDNLQLQEFADVCADVDSQITCLPGLGCLNFPTAIAPIVEKTPLSLRSKWEKEIAIHAEANEDAYPGFHVFSEVVQRQAQIKNHPNIVAGIKSMPKSRKTEQRKTYALATKFSDTSSKTATCQDGEEKYCEFHDRKGHSLTECKAFNAKTLDEKNDWIMKEMLCFRCLKRVHLSKDCKIKVCCDKCESDRHPTILHKEKSHGEEDVSSKCTAVCKNKEVGMSCSKMLLVDVFLDERPHERHRVYAIVDDQSNASMITRSLADKLGVLASREKYLLSTCSGEREVNYGRRVPGVLVTANGRTSKLPTLVECAHIPQDKSEIATPEIARKFAYLKDIADEIPPLDVNAKVHLLIGRDASELLKVRAFKNDGRFPVRSA